MDENEFYPFSLPDLESLMDSLSHHPSLLTGNRPKRKGSSDPTHISNLILLAIHLWKPTPENHDRIIKLGIKTSSLVLVPSRKEMLYGILKHWIVEGNDGIVNLSDLVKILREIIQMRHLSVAIEKFHIEYSLPFQAEGNEQNDPEALDLQQFKKASPIFLEPLNSTLIPALSPLEGVISTPPSLQVPPITLSPLTTTTMIKGPFVSSPLNPVLEQAFSQVYIITPLKVEEETPTALEEETREKLKIANTENPFQMVVGNHILLDKIFRSISSIDQANARQASKAFLDTSLSFWRQKMQIKLFANKGGDKCLCKNRNSLNPNTLLLLVDFANMKENNEMQLRDHPYHNYSISYRKSSSQSQDSDFAPLLLNTNEMNFWMTCGPDMKTLKLCCTRLGKMINRRTGLLESKIQWLITNVTKKLEMLELCNFQYDNKNIQHQPKQKATHQFQEVNAETGVNPNLTVLKFSGINNSSPNLVSDILLKCPNLQELHITSPQELSGLLHPTSTDEQIRLRRLYLTGESMQFNHLYNYICAVPDSLLVLNINHVRVSYLRSPPFLLYACLAKCVNLTSFKINIYTENRERIQWFFDLAPFTFTNLKVLKICFKTQAPFLNILLKFDFDTLKGMSKMEHLEITYDTTMRVERNFGTLDYFYSGDRRNLFVPNVPGVRTNLTDSNIPLLCEFLHTFSFNGWHFGSQDVHNVFKWFPKLNCIYIKGDKETLNALVNYAKQLKKILFVSERHNISLVHFRRLMEIKPSMVLCVRFGTTLITEYKVVVHNDRIMFKKGSSSNDWVLNY